MKPDGEVKVVNLRQVMKVMYEVVGDYPIGVAIGSGMDWMKPLLLLLCSCLIWYGAILLVFMGYSEPCNCSPDRMLNAFQFALPTHRLENIFRPLSNGVYPPLAWVFDTLSRVTSSFFIYEMIAAFRKYSRF